VNSAIPSKVSRQWLPPSGTAIGDERPRPFIATPIQSFTSMVVSFRTAASIHLHSHLNDVHVYKKTKRSIKRYKFIYLILKSTTFITIVMGRCFAPNLCEQHVMAVEHGEPNKN
jgi:hypothetical protein